MALTLYSYYRSSAAYRVRIALNLKQVDYQIQPVHLLNNGGEQYSADFLALNPQARVPVLAIDDTVLIQSSAIIEYLEEVYPQPPLLPESPEARAYVRSLAQIVACEMHPLNNLKVLQYLDAHSTIDSRGVWYRHWLKQGFIAFEQLLQQRSYYGSFCFGDYPSIADTFLIPQVYNALRYDFELSALPLIHEIYQAAMQDAAFIKAAPENQIDAE